MKGFSFLELCILIAIVGFLASIAIPAYINYKAKENPLEYRYMAGDKPCVLGTNVFVERVNTVSGGYNVLFPDGRKAFVYESAMEDCE